MHQELRTYLETNLPRYLALLRQWIETNSYTANPAGVNAVGDLSAAAFAGLGFTAERLPSDNPRFGNHLVLTRKGSSGLKLGLISHLDTVFPPEEERANDFHWRVEGDRLYGPGANDIKGGTLLILMLLEALQKFDLATFEAVTWVVLLNAAEEVLSDDFGELCRQRLGTDGLAALVFEAGQHDEDTFWLVTRRKGMANYRITVEGKAAHSGSNHTLGANAVVQLAELIGKVAALTDYRRDLTFNVGPISGGVVSNRVPHFARASGEMRTFDAAVYAEALEKLLALQEQVSVVSADGYPCKIAIEIVHKTSPWPQNPGTEALYAAWEQAAAELGFALIREARGGLSDGNHLWNTLPTIDGLGPAGANGHCSERAPDGSKDQEYASLSSFAPKTVLNFVAIQKLIHLR